LLSLRWTQVDLAAGTVSLPPGTTKNSKARLVVFESFPELKEMFDAQRKLPFVTPFVFHRNGKQIKSFGKRWKAACRKAGCLGRTLHDFRRTAARELDRAGVPRVVAKQITGHLTDSMYDRYNIVSEKDLREAGAKVAARLG
jgi:integrase